MRKQSFPFWFVLFSILSIVSCRKSDIETPEAEKPASFERFFKLSESADPRLKAIARSIRSQEKDHPFLKDFIKRAGWPVWDKSRIIGKQNRNNGRGSNEDSSALVYIPFVQDSAITVNSVLAVRMNVIDTAWRMLYAANYASFGFDTTTSDNWNARNVFQFFALFQHDVFGHTTFRLNDSRLFDSGDSAIVRLKERNGQAITGRTNRTSDWHEVTECGSWEVCRSTPPPSEARTNSFPYCRIVSVCNIYYYDDGLNGTGGTGWTGSSWTGSGGGGGGGGGSWANNDPCATENSCMAGWTPQNTYVTLDGETFTPENYPGMNFGYPWLWWEYAKNNTEIDQNVTDNDPSMTWWDTNVSDPNTVYTQQPRPNFFTMNGNYPKTSDGNDDMPSAAVCAMIGGEVLTKYNQGSANNTCCLRVSRALLYSGINIPEITGQTWKGADGKNYFYYVEHLFNWLNKTFGAPDIHKTAADGAPRGTKFADLLGGIQNRGIYIMKPTSRTAFGASGHASLWGGLNAIGGNNYFKDASDVYIWKLPQ